jgi:ABC-type amino acid transport substrate-binding protein
MDAVPALIVALRRVMLSAWAIGSLLACAAPVQATETTLRVAIIDNIPPLSYSDAAGQHCGFAVDLAHALCEAMQERCRTQIVRLSAAVDSLAADQFDFASINLLATPERRQKILFSKPFYRSVSVWLARPGVHPGAAGTRVVAVRGSAQARYIEAQGWPSVFVDTHFDMQPVLERGAADAIIAPMLTSVLLLQDERIQKLGLQSTIMNDAAIAGDVAISINPKRADLQPRIDAAIDQIKADGRFDRINTKYLPFRLQ